MTRDDTLLTDAYRQLARDWSAWTTGTLQTWQTLTEAYAATGGGEP